MNEVCRRFERVGMNARPIGSVTDSSNLSITYRNQKTSVFDLKKNGIMGIFSHLVSQP